MRTTNATTFSPIGSVVEVCTRRLLASVVVLVECLTLSTVVSITYALAQVPDTERATLINLYNSTGGPGWFTSTNWNGAAGTECTWYGVTCTSGHVTAISLQGNTLIGALPEINELPELRYLDVGDNYQITGSIPPLTGLISLIRFYAQNNQLSGPIPSFSGLANLEIFAVDNNALTGSIPSFDGLSKFSGFDARHNKLSGLIPSLAGLSNLSIFTVYDNLLSGPIPALTGLANLQEFAVSNNRLTGGIPSLAGLANLRSFDVSDNPLAGTLPSLTGLSSLAGFFASNNQLSGPVPSLANLTSLVELDVSNNHLTGSIPSFAGLSSLTVVDIGGNNLSGNLPTVPDPNGLLSGYSNLCPNGLNRIDSTAWDSATGHSPWWETPHPNNACDDLFNDTFDK